MAIETTVKHEDDADIGPVPVQNIEEQVELTRQLLNEVDNQIDEFENQGQASRQPLDMSSKDLVTESFKMLAMVSG